MIKANENYLKLPGNYLFSEIDKRVAVWKNAHPEKASELISLGIGDVSRPLAPGVVAAMEKAVKEQGHKETFRGYRTDSGYEFLREAIIKNEFAPRGIHLDIDEIFISDGAKSDTGNMGDIFSDDCVVAVCDPVYTVYADANVMAGRAGTFDGKYWSRFINLPCTAENDFLPQIPDQVADLIYLCLPNNPTGSAATREQLKLWVDYALKNHSIIIMDAAYEAFITREDVPHSIYEIEGAKECAIECHSFSKMAGFTGTRCGFAVVPKELNIDGISVNHLWERRQTTKFNGVSYIVQRGAEAVYTKETKQSVAETIAYYMANAQKIRLALENLGLRVYGGIDCPFVWSETPKGMSSWDFFDQLIDEAQIIATPGAGFGPNGEGFVRFSAFGEAANVDVALHRMEAMQVFASK